MVRFKNVINNTLLSKSVYNTVHFEKLRKHYIFVLKCIEYGQARTKARAAERRVGQLAANQRCSPAAM